MGRSKKSRKCPRCGGKDIILQDTFDDVSLYVCADCDFEFEVGGYGRKSRSDDDDDFDDKFDSEKSEENEEEWER